METCLRNTNLIEIKAALMGTRNLDFRFSFTVMVQHNFTTKRYQLVGNTLIMYLKYGKLVSLVN